MACHNGISAPVAFADGLYRSVAEGIECEQCHGPGSLHVEARLAESEAPDSVDYTIVNPAHLPLDLRLDVCQQCHTNGSVSMLREGEEPYGFRPSEALAEHVAIFALVSDDPKRISVISHAQRMQQSPCFIESGVMDCTTCHNPHEGFREAGPSYFNETCQTCHTTPTLQQAMPTPELQAQHSIEANCFACHMPKVEAEDAPHSSFTDHYIRVVRNDQIEGTATARGTAELAPYFTRDAEGQEARIYQGMAYIVYGRNEGGGDALRRGINLLSEALDARPEFGEAQFLLGFAHLQLSQAAQAVAPLEASVEVNPEVPERLNALAQAYEQTGRPLGEIEALYRQALAIQPVAASIRVNLGRFLDAQGRVQEALTEYRQAVQDEPFLATAHYNLGTAFLRLGNVDDGEDALREAVHLNPDHADALTNLGVLAGSRGNAREALDFFKRAVEAEPRNANALANLALAYAQLGDTNQARLYAQEALSVEPGHPTAQQVLAAL